MLKLRSKNLEPGDVDLMEFQRLRSEIDNRTTISESIIIAHITALATGLSLLEKVPDVLLALSYVSSLLWLSWLAHTRQIYKLSGYIAIVLAPRLPKLPEKRALYWEEYSRMVDRVGTRAFGLSYPHLLKEAIATIATAAHYQNISWFIGMFFMCGPLLLFIYVIVILGKQCGIDDLILEPVNYLRLMLMGGSLYLWCVARKRYKETDAVRKAIEDAVLKNAFESSISQ